MESKQRPTMWAGTSYAHRWIYVPRMGWKLSQILNNTSSNTQVLDKSFALVISKVIWAPSLNVHKAISICTACLLRSVNRCQEVRPFVVKCITIKCFLKLELNRLPQSIPGYITWWMFLLILSLAEMKEAYFIVKNKISQRIWESPSISWQLQSKCFLDSPL